MGLEPDSLVGVAKEFEQRRNRSTVETVAKEPCHLEAGFGFAKAGVVHRPNAAKFVGLPLAVPIGDVHRAVWAKVDCAGHHAEKEDVLIYHFEVSAPWFGGKRGDFLDREFTEEKVALVTVVQGGARVELKTSRANGELAHRRGDVGGLPLPVRQPKFLVDPRAVSGRLGLFRPASFFELPVEPPTGIAALSNVNKTLTLFADIPVVVHREQVAVVVECEFLNIAKADGKHLEMTAVPIAAQDTARVRVMQQLAFSSANREAVVADREVQFAVRANSQSVKIMSVESGVNTKTVKENLLFVSVSIAINIVQFPYVGIDGGKHVTPVGQHTGNNAVNLLVKALRVHLCHVSLAIVVGVLKQMNALLDGGQIAPVMRAVLVAIWKPWFVMLAQRRGHFGAEQTPDIANCLTG
ncbi:MAG: hypothetical protein QF749_07350 [Verrucomicrobiota bacterium]|nr:hypothetical protein [Verrucomicrobiota bacterium]